MYRSQVNILINFLMLLDGIGVIWCGYISLIFSREWELPLWQIDGYVFIVFLIFCMFINNFVMSRVGLYRESRSTSYWHTIQSMVVVVVIDFGAYGLIITVGQLAYFTPFFLLVYAFTLFLFFVMERGFLELYLEKRQNTSFNSRQILLVGGDEKAVVVAKAMERQRSWGHQFVGCLVPEGVQYFGCDGQTSNLSGLPVIGDLSDLSKTLRTRHIDEVVFALPGDSSVILQPYLEICKEMGISVRIVPNLFNPSSKSVRAESVQGIPTLCLYSGMINASGLLYKRVLDLVIGLMGFIGFLLIYPIIGLAIKLDSPGPVLFKQRRVGQNGRIFWLYKFRTMYLNAEEKKEELMARNEMQGFMFKIGNDPRITRVGRFLRNTSLDEVPQFLNVLRGEMSLVGTRPPTFDEVQMYEAWHRRRLSMKPGITGLWQISGRNKITDFARVVELDLNYIDGWRFIDDLFVLLKTIRVVIFRKGAK